MSLSIDWPNKVITIPKAYMTLDTSDPYDIYILEANQFHLDLRAEEVTEQGIINDATHNHTTIVTLGGTTFARLVEIINDYTMTFEDGQYAVAINGANTNFADVLTLNQVSVRTANTAGLIETAGGSGDAGAVWDVILEDHEDPGSTGEALGTLKGGRQVPAP